MLEIIPKNLNIDFVGKRYIWFGFSTLIVLASLVLFLTKGLNYGIDFTGGAEIQVQFQEAFSISDLRKTLEESGFKNVSIQQLGDAQTNEFLFKVRSDEAGLQGVSERAAAVFTKKFANAYEMKRVDVVGPQAGAELRKSGYLAMFYALLCILIYVAIRFDYRYSPGAVLALFHDSLITIGIFVLTQKEFSLQIVAAILTIIGYSNNDTIIVYDRIRETIKNFPQRSLAENINRSINETLSRTILTSATTLLVVVALMMLGGGVIHDFAFTMCIGIVVGTYSSIFIASPILLFITKHQAGKENASANNNQKGKLTAQRV